MKKIYILSLFLFCYVASFAQKFDEQVKSLTESIYDKVTVDPRKADSCLAVIEGRIAEYATKPMTDKNAVELAVYHAVAGWMYDNSQSRNTRRNADNTYKAKSTEHWNHVLDDKRALALAKAKNYKSLVKIGADGKLFNHDMLWVMTQLVEKEVSHNKRDSLYADVKEVYRTLGNTDAVTTIEDMLVYFKSDDYNPKDTDDHIRYWREMQKKYPKSHYLNYYVNQERELLEPRLSVRRSDNIHNCVANKPFGYVLNYWNTTNATLIIREYDGVVKGQYRWQKVLKKTGKVVKTMNFTFGGDTANQRRVKDNLPVKGTDSINVTLPAGRYVFTFEANGSEDTYQVCVTSICAFAYRDAGKLYCVVLDVMSGKPVENVEVRMYADENDRDENKKVLETRKTNSEGKAVMYNITKNGYYSLRAFASKNNFVDIGFHRSGIYTEKSDTTIKCELFTDRAIYRPGQKVRVSGVLYRYTGKDTYEVVRDYDTKIKLYLDYNNPMEESVKSNSFGSVDAEFTLPKDAKLGRYRLECVSGNANITVEEYKRPTWELKLEGQRADSTRAVALGDTLVVEGTAMSYAGVPVQLMNVEYDVYSSTSFHSWYINPYYSDWNFQNEGIVDAGSDGKFRIIVPLCLDEGTMKQFDGFVRFKIHVKATDIAGETHEQDYFIGVFKDDYVLVIDGRNKLDLNEETTYKVQALDALNKHVDVKVECTLSLKDKVIGTKTIKAGDVLRISELWNGDKDDMPMGDYVLNVVGKDRNGKDIKVQKTILVYDTNEKTLVNRKIESSQDFIHCPDREISKDKTAKIYFAPSEDSLYVYRYTAIQNKVFEEKVELIRNKIYIFEVKYDEAMGNGVDFEIYYAKNGVMKSHRQSLTLVRPKKEMNLSWHTFRDKLQPGHKETWKLKIQSPDGKPHSSAELLATMYDATLDEFVSHRFSSSIYPSRFYRNFEICTNSVYGDPWIDLVGYYKDQKVRAWVFDKFTLFDNLWANFNSNMLKYTTIKEVRVGAQRARTMNVAEFEGLQADEALQGRISGLDIKASRKENVATLREVVLKSDDDIEKVANVEESTNETPISAPLRSNFAETAFFYPHIVTDKDGVAEISFTLPESLTKWKFLGFAHDKEMNNGVITAEAVAQKSFMVQPQMPRFIRVGDEAMIPVRIINQGDKSIKGRVQMRILNARTEEAIKSLTQTQTFSCGADTTIVVTFPITATSSADDYICEVVAEGNVKGEEIKGAKGLNSKVKGSKDSSLFTLHSSFSDGERNLLPVLPSRVKLTESVPFYIDNAGEKIIDLSKVYNGNSSTAEDKTMSIEYTANPVWTVVEALRQIDTPESPSAPSLAASVYANSMLLALDTKFSAYTQKPVVNRDTVGVKLTKAMKELKDLQCNDGGFRWFSGFERSSYYITLLVAEQLVKAPLPPKGAAVQNSGDVQELKGSKGSVIGKDTNALTRKDAPFGGWGALLSYLDSIQVERYEFNRANKIKTVPSESDFHYLYVCSMTPERKVSSKAKALRNEMLSYIETHSQELSIYGLSASSNILRAFGRKSSADKFLNVVRHYLVKDEGLGKHFESNRAQYSWYDYRIPTQVAAMEAFYAVNPKDDNLNDMTIWLLRQKQVQSWDNPANTVNVCDLLLKMNDSAISSALLTHDSSLPRMTLNGKQLTDKSFVKDNVKKDSLYFAEEIGYMNKQVSPSLAENAKTLRIQRNNGSNVQRTSNSSISWGAVTVTFTEESNKLNSYTTGEVRISRRIMVEDNSSSLPKWRDLSEGETLKVGQKVRVRHTLHTDRDMDYVRVKTLHPACFEPVDKLSGYQWKGGEGCYQSIHDSYIEMFFQTYHEGTSTLDIDYYVTRPGTYNMGITSAECTYAPMYGGHSDGMTVKVVGN